MALGTNLTTNEVKNAAGTEVEFYHLSSNGSTRVLAQASETPNLPHRITISHQETGVGDKKRRRSVIRVDKAEIGANTLTGAIVNHAAYIVLDIPIGNISDLDESKNVLAEVTSLVATLANNTFLYDGTGNGADVLLKGSLQNA